MENRTTLNDKYQSWRLVNEQSLPPVTETREVQNLDIKIGTLEIKGRAQHPTVIIDGRFAPLRKLVLTLEAGEASNVQMEYYPDFEWKPVKPEGTTFTVVTDILLENGKVTAKTAEVQVDQAGKIVSTKANDEAK